MEKGETNKKTIKIPHINYHRHPAYRPLFGRPSISLRIAALKRIVPYLWGFKRILFHNVNRRVRTALTEDLYQNGFKIFRLSKDEIQFILSHVQPYINEIEQGKEATPLASRTHRSKVRCMNQNKEGQFYAYMKILLEKRQLHEMASEYRGCPMELIGLCVQVGDKDDPDIKNHFEDIPDPDSYYFHIDGSESQVKCMIYLNEVTTETGPTGYIRGSNQNKLGRFELLVRVANDKARLDKCRRESRELFSALPKIFQKKAEFGNDLSPDQAKDFLSDAIEFTSDKGNLMIFDPSGFHRGKVVQEGKRIVLQVIFARHG